MNFKVNQIVKVNETGYIGRVKWVDNVLGIVVGDCHYDNNKVTLINPYVPGDVLINKSRSLKYTVVATQDYLVAISDGDNYDILWYTVDGTIDYFTLKSDTPETITVGDKTYLKADIDKLEEMK